MNKCTKEQLLKIADHFETEISDKRSKDTIKTILKANFNEIGVLAVKLYQRTKGNRKDDLNYSEELGGIAFQILGHLVEYEELNLASYWSFYMKQNDKRVRIINEVCKIIPFVQNLEPSEENPLKFDKFRRLK